MKIESFHLVDTVNKRHYKIAQYLFQTPRYLHLFKQRKSDRTIYSYASSFDDKSTRVHSERERTLLPAPI